jgi:hypothetical protein
LCKSSGGSEYQSYRLIDGRKCWFAGRRRPDKAELHWEHVSDRTAVRHHPRPSPDVKPEIVRSPESAPLMGQPGDLGSSFSDRWSEMMDKLIGNQMEEYRER